MTVLCWLQYAKRNSYGKVFSLYVPQNSVQTVRIRERQAVNKIYDLEATDLCELDSSATSGFRDVGVICSLLGYYAEYGSNSLPTFRDMSVPS
jgi:hypothetical protein